MDYFQLSLSSTDNAFYAGQTVEGIIRVGLSQPMAVNSIIVRLAGRVRTSFQKRERIFSDKDRTEYEYVRYAAEQICLDLSVNIPDAKPGNNLLVAQQNEFPFSFQLPADLPPSFTGKHGSVTYTCAAVLHRTEWYKANSITEKKITIVPAFLASPADFIPLKEDIGNEVGWLCC
ncbi:arrestin domain-containing protein 2, partial [Aphelenchoides avenae]